MGRFEIQEELDSDAFMFEEEDEELFGDDFAEEEEDDEDGFDSEYERRINDPEYSKKFVEALPLDVQQRVRVLQDLQQKKNEVHQEYLNDLLALQRKYESDFEPLLNQRRSIIEGNTEPTQEAIQAGYPQEHAQRVSLTLGERTGAKGIPDFWLKVLQQSPAIRMSISPRDEEVLTHLVDIRCKASEVNPSAGFTLFFEFTENPFFEEKILTKEYIKEPCVANGIGEWYLSDIKGTKITWKGDEVNTTIESTRKKQRSKKTKEIRYVTVYEPCGSFFTFFKAPKFPDSMKPPSADAGDKSAHSDEDEYGEEELEDLIDEDYEIGSVIKEKLILRAVDYFTGELEAESDGFDDEEFEEEEYSDDDLDDVNSEDLTNRMISRCRVGNSRAKKSAQPKESNQEECKQQ